MSQAAAKAEARRAAFARRKTADPVAAKAANRHLEAAVRSARGSTVSGYWPIRSEIDPRPTLHSLAPTHTVCLPVVGGRDRPLVFRRWTPDSLLIEGVFGAAIPADRTEVTPEILIVPLIAFDPAGYRLGYGGGFYDRTLEGLRRDSPVTAIGFAYSVQACPQVPREPTDQRLDLIVTEAGILAPA